MVISFTATLLVIHLCVTSKSDKSSGHPELVPSSLVAQMVKNLPVMQETLVRSLGWEDLLEKVMATHSSILAWRIPRTEEPDRLQSGGCQELDMTE